MQFVLGTMLQLELRAIWAGKRTRVASANLFALQKTEEEFLSCGWVKVFQLLARSKSGIILDYPLLRQGAK